MTEGLVRHEQLIAAVRLIAAGEARLDPAVAVRDRVQAVTYTHESGLVQPGQAPAT